MKIYEIEAAILECIDIETGEIIDFAKLQELEIDRQAKIDNIACWYKQLNAESTAIETEIKALKERQKSKESKAESLKQYLSDILGGEKFESTRNVITWRKSDEVSIIDEGKLSAAYIREIVKFEPDKKAIKEAIKSGQSIDGAELIYKNNIQIK